MLVDEHALAEFRRERLSPAALLDLIQRSVAVLVRLGVGVGKSIAIDKLLTSPALYSIFDIVLYTAPTWNVIRERAVLRDPNSTIVPVAVLEPRPVERCGRYAKRWDALEKRGCAALAKATLCKECRAATPIDPCLWPEQWRDLKNIRLFFAPEQQMFLNRSLVPMLKARTKAKRMLVILDEAKILDLSFRIEIQPDDLTNFIAVLEDLDSDRASNVKTWLTALHALQANPAGDLRRLRLKLPFALLYEAEQIQRIGLRRFGDRFRFIGYDLLQLQFSRTGERQRRLDGRVVFTARPYLRTHLFITSAHLKATYVAHRLGVASIASPFEETIVRHTGTRVFNLRSRLGCDSYFAGNKKQILDTIAVLIRRNVMAAKTTLLVSRLKSKSASATYLAERLRGWGLVVRFVTDGGPLPLNPDPAVIPIIHFGVLGVNDYMHYECAYCVNGYYVSSAVLNRALAEFEPDAFGDDVKILTGDGLERRAVLVERGIPDADRTLLANLYLQRLEVDPVVQAIGRVRFLTSPRQVVFFQMANLRPQIGEVVELRSLVALRRTLGVPDPKEIDASVQTEGLRVHLADGLSVEEAAVRTGISRRTAFRRLAEAQSAKNPLRINSIRGFGTPDATGGAA